MEKKVTNNYGFGPWPLRKNGIKDFLPITHQNKKNAIVYGRIFYVIEQVGSLFIFKGTFSFDPCFIQGWLHYPYKPWQKSDKAHFRVYMNADMDFNECRALNQHIINKHVDENSLYIKHTDPILTYLVEDKK